MHDFMLRPLRADSLLPIEVAADSMPVTLGRRHKGVPDEPRFRAIHRQHCSIQATQEGLKATQLGATPLARKRGFQLTTSSFSGDTLLLLAGDELHLLHPTHSSAAVGCVYVVGAGAGGQADAPASSERPRPAPVHPGGAVEDDSLEVTCGRRLVIKGRGGVVQEVEEGSSGTPDVLVLFDNGEEDLISYAGALRAVRAARLLPARAPAAAAAVAPNPALAAAPMAAPAPAPRGEAKHSSGSKGKGLKEARAAGAEEEDEDKPLRAPKQAKKGKGPKLGVVLDTKPEAGQKAQGTTEGTKALGTTAFGTTALGTKALGTKEAALRTLDKGAAAKKRPRVPGQENTAGQVEAEAGEACCSPAVVPSAPREKSAKAEAKARAREDKLDRDEAKANDEAEAKPASGGRVAAAPELTHDAAGQRGPPEPMEALPARPDPPAVPPKAAALPPPPPPPPAPPPPPPAPTPHASEPVPAASKPAAEMIDLMAADLGWQPLPPPPPRPAAPKPQPAPAAGAIIDLMAAAPPPMPAAAGVIDLMTAAELQVVAAPAAPKPTNTSPFAEAVAAANPAAYAAAAATLLAKVAAAAAADPIDSADPAAAAAAAAAATKARGAAAAAAAFAAPPTSAGLGGEAELEVDGDEELEEVFESYRPP